MKRYHYIAFKTGMWLASTGKQYVSDIYVLGQKAFGYGKPPPPPPAADASEEEKHRFTEDVEQYLARDDLHFLDRVVYFDSLPDKKLVEISEKHFTVFNNAAAALHDVADDIMQEFEGQTIPEEETETEELFAELSQT